MFVVKSVMNSRIFVVFFVIEHFLQLIKAQRRFAIWNQYLNKSAAHTQSKVTTAYRIFTYHPRKNGLSAFTASADCATWSNTTKSCTTIFWRKGFWTVTWRRFSREPANWRKLSWSRWHRKPGWRSRWKRKIWWSGFAWWTTSGTRHRKSWRIR